METGTERDERGGGERRSTGWERGRERGRGGNGDGDGDGKGDGGEDSSGNGNGDEDSGNGNKDRIGEGGKEAKRAKPPKIVLDAVRETRETWVEREKNVEKRKSWFSSCQPRQSRE